MFFHGSVCQKCGFDDFSRLKKSYSVRRDDYKFAHVNDKESDFECHSSYEDYRTKNLYKERYNKIKNDIDEYWEKETC